MIYSTDKSSNFTSFFDVTFVSTPDKLLKSLPSDALCEDNTGRDKANFNWTLVTDTGILFNIYDWKYYRPLDLNEPVIWHIRGFSKSQTEDALEKLLEYLK